MTQSSKLERRQHILATFGDFVLDHDDLDDILNEACRLIAEALETDLAKVIETDLSTRTGLIRAGVGWNPGIVGQERVSLNERSSEAFAIAQGVPVITNDIAHEERFVFPAFLLDHGVIAVANVPILLPGRRPYGVLQVDARERRDFAQDDIEFLKIYAMVLGPVIDRLQTAAELRHTYERLRLIVENTRAYVMVVSDADDRITDWLGGSEEILGWSASDAIGQSADVIFTGEDRKAGVPQRELRDARNHGAAADLRWHQRRDGSRVFIDGQPIALKDQRGKLRGYFKIGQDFTERKRNEEQQGFLLSLSDALRSLTTVGEIVKLAVFRLGEQLGVNRVFYGEIDGDKLTVEEDYTCQVPSIIGGHSLAAFDADFLANYRPGVIVTVSDVATDPRFGDAARSGLHSRQIAAFVDLVLFDAGRKVGVIGVQNASPRDWNGAEESLIQEVGERVRSAIERARAEERRRESENQLAAIFEQASVGLSEYSLTGQFLRVNDEKCRLTGRSREELLRLGISDVVLPADLGASIAAQAQVAATGHPCSIDKRYLRPDGSTVWANSCISLLRHHNGSPYSFLAVTADLTSRRVAELALRESEDRYRAILESVLDYAIFTTDGEGVIETWPPGAEAVFGWTAAEAIGRNVAITFVPEERADGGPQHELATAREHGFAPNVRWHIRKDERRVFIEGSARPLSNGHITTDGFLIVGQDVTKRRQSEERQKILVGELQHRTRNLIAVIQSMAGKTMRRAKDLPDFRENFRDRLDALARVQGLLSRLDENDRVSFDELVRIELSAMGALGGTLGGVMGSAERVVVAGPSGIRLRSSTVQTLALALHELATNAAKYGALAQPQAQLAIRWHLGAGGEDDRPWLHIDWRESGVTMPTPAAAAKGSGQGRELIERALPYQLSAKTSYILSEDGVHCTISIPVSGLTSGDPHG